MKRNPDSGDTDERTGAPDSDDAFARGAAADGEDDVSTAQPASSATQSSESPTVDDQRDRYLRLAAEYENYRKRSTRERQEAGSRAQADLVKQLIDALDDLSRFAHVDPAKTEPATFV